MGEAVVAVRQRIGATAKGVHAMESKKGFEQQKQDQQKPQPQARPQQPGGGRKNSEETGEPIQLPDDKTRHGEQGKPGMGQREGQQGGQHQGGGQHGGQREGANR
jgi:hypothetical protein